MKRLIKKSGVYLLGLVNFNIPRLLNGRIVNIPVRSGIKVGISGERWLSGILKILLNSSQGTFLDIGANRGQTLSKVKTVNPEQEYIGIEPNPSCVFYLHQLISKNRWKNAVIVPVGIYPEPCLLRLSGGYDTDGSSTIIDEFKSPGKYGDITSKLVPLLPFSKIEQSLSIKQLSIIKIDVEGAELEVLECLKDLINTHRPNIILEVWPINDEPAKVSRLEKLNNILASLDYVVYSWVPTSHPPYYKDFKQAVLGRHSADNYLLLPTESHEKTGKLLVN